MFKDNYRWKMISWLVVIVFISFFDRMNFSVSAPLIMKELSIKTGLMGIIMSAFNAGYMLLNFSGGFLAEKYSSRKFMTIIVLLWSLMTFMTGFGWSFISLLIIRFLFGICEGPLTIINSKLVNRWVLPHERGKASGLWLAAIPVSTMIGVVLSGMIVSSYGWRSVFYIFGIAGIILAILNWKILCDGPEDCPSISEKELNKIRLSIRQEELENAGTPSGSSLTQILKNPLVWLICAVYFSLMIYIWGNLNWLPTYFVKARGTSVRASGFLTAFPLLGGAIGTIVIGWLSDRQFLLKTRSSWVILSMFIMAPATVFSILTPSLNICLACLTIAIFFSLGANVMMYTYVMGAFKKADVAKVIGIMIGCGSMSGIVAPSLMGYILQVTDSFNYAYYTFAAFITVAGLLSIILYKKEIELKQGRPITLLRATDGLDDTSG